jgi:hypothetical protein
MLKILSLLILMIFVTKPFLALSNHHLPTNEELRGRKNLEDIVSKTPGTPFPKPQSQIVTDTQQILDQKDFSFQYGKSSVVCDLLNLAFNRFYKIIFRPQSYDIKGDGVLINQVKKLHRQNKETKENTINQARLLKRVIINVQMPCEDYPSLESDESCLYSIKI